MADDDDANDRLASVCGVSAFVQVVRLGCCSCHARRRETRMIHGPSLLVFHLGGTKIQGWRWGKKKRVFHFCCGSDSHVKERGMGRECGETATPAAAQISVSGPGVEVYGFGLWVGSLLLWLLFVCWAYLPDHLLNRMGVTYYPDKYVHRSCSCRLVCLNRIPVTSFIFPLPLVHRYWAAALPLWLCITIVFVMLMYGAVNVFSTNSLDSIHAITGRRKDEEKT